MICNSIACKLVPFHKEMIKIHHRFSSSHISWFHSPSILSCFLHTIGGNSSAELQVLLLWWYWGYSLRLCSCYSSTESWRHIANPDFIFHFEAGSHLVPRWPWIYSAAWAVAGTTGMLPEVQLHFTPSWHCSSYLGGYCGGYWQDDCFCHLCCS